MTAALSLRDRLAALRSQHKKSAPSFTPGPRQSRAKKVAEVLPDVSELVPQAELEAVRELIQDHLAYGADERRAKRGKKPVAEALKAVCKDYGLTKATCLAVGGKFSYYPQEREKIIGQLLRDEGVSEEIIQRCTVRTSSFAIRVSPIDAEDEETDDDDS